jgi:hypothetical protein
MRALLRRHDVALTAVGLCGNDPLADSLNALRYVAGLAGGCAATLGTLSVVASGCPSFTLSPLRQSGTTTTRRWPSPFARALREHSLQAGLHL